MNAINEFLRRAKALVIKPKISLVGDMMVDQYYYVDASRVSPEFPVPVMKSDRESKVISVPGGVGNVASQFKHFNVDLRLHTLMDRNANIVLDDHGINVRYCHKMWETGHVPLKKRYYQGDFPLCRWDVEENDYGMGGDIDRWREMLLESFLTASVPDVVVFSDYDKGVFSGKGCKKKWMHALSDETISIVDPKRSPVDEWAGCTVFKPNAVEAEAMSGLKDWREQCEYFQDKLRCMAVIITQGGDGVVGKVGASYFEYAPRCNVSANSVIGAGDCFVSFLAIGLALEMDLVDAVKVAFEAGSVYVQNRHNKPVSSYELLKHVDSEAAKLMKPPVIRDYKLIWTNGCFDFGLTKGHVEYLRQARSLGDKLVVAVNGDDSVRRLKGEGRPIMSLEERMRILAALECVDFVVSFDEDTPFSLISEIMPDMIVKGGDYKVEDVVGGDLIPVTILDTVDCLSTTQKIEKLRASI